MSGCPCRLLAPMGVSSNRLPPEPTSGRLLGPTLALRSLGQSGGQSATSPHEVAKRRESMGAVANRLVRPCAGHKQNPAQIRNDPERRAQISYIGTRWNSTPFVEPTDTADYP